ncbi:hypothetical protein AZE42_12400 [Rhizopogon vesiculosus]|uniref:Uncharacterized protein n=1 Tax=Rhizopogon vesiculosus TaxID=180088 RepID=A0A1J8PP96_9AGAM|nr:hypothetical protein AZE42_12400 [Rhizopogon vesiculosus]
MPKRELHTHLFFHISQRSQPTRIGSNLAGIPFLNSAFSPPLQDLLKKTAPLSPSTSPEGYFQGNGGDFRGTRLRRYVKDSGGVQAKFCLQARPPKLLLSMYVVQ